MSSHKVSHHDLENEENWKNATLALKALGHPSRLEILRQLAIRDRCCGGDFCDCLSLAQSTISQHLEMLCASGLVERRASGTRSIYTINREELAKLGQTLQQLAHLTDYQMETTL